MSLAGISIPVKSSGDYVSGAFFFDKWLLGRNYRGCKNAESMFKNIYEVMNGFQDY